MKGEDPVNFRRTGGRERKDKVNKEKKFCEYASETTKETRKQGNEKV